MSARWWTFAVWALVAASALFWGMGLFVRPPPAPVHARLAEPATAARGDLARLLGADAPAPVAQAAPALQSRFQLIGVVTPRASASAREGLALIAVDGRPPKAFRVGAVVDGPTVLKSVAARGAALGSRDGTGEVALSIAPPPAAATGALPAPGAANAAPAPVTQVMPTAVQPSLRRSTRPGAQDDPARQGRSREEAQTE